MPYISESERARIDYGAAPETPGQLNYVLTEACLDYLPADPSYTDYNEVIGVLEAMKLELYRMHVAIYEDRKRHVNGPVQSTKYNGAKSQMDALVNALVKCTCPLHAGRTHPSAPQPSVDDDWQGREIEQPQLFTEYENDPALD